MCQRRLLCCWQEGRPFPEIGINFFAENSALALHHGPCRSVPRRSPTHLCAAGNTSVCLPGTLAAFWRVSSFSAAQRTLRGLSEGSEGSSGVGRPLRRDLHALPPLFCHRHPPHAIVDLRLVDRNRAASSAAPAAPARYYCGAATRSATLRWPIGSTARQRPPVAAMPPHTQPTTAAYSAIPLHSNR